MNDEGTPMRGRQAEARRNDARILEAALDVFSADPDAPMSAVARRAEVGQASLYRRYPTKQALLTEVADRGMTGIRDAAQAAAGDDDPADALARFMDWYVDSGTLRLADLLGSYAPPDRLFVTAREANQAIAALVGRAAAAGAIRPDVTGADLTLLARQIGTVDLGDADRATGLRRRYVALALLALAQADDSELPGPPPDDEELEVPWRSSDGGSR
jgi:AcrR family transcriptional regulator